VLASSEEAWSTLPSRQSAQSRPKLPIRCAAKFTLPGGLFGKNRQPNPTLFSSPSQANPGTPKRSLTGRLDAIRTPSTRKITMFHPTPMHGPVAQTSSSPTPSSSIAIKPPQRPYLRITTSINDFPDQKPLTDLSPGSSPTT